MDLTINVESDLIFTPFTCKREQNMHYSVET
jgi:hypothetical protein